MDLLGEESSTPTTNYLGFANQSSTGQVDLFNFRGPLNDGAHHILYRFNERSSHHHQFIIIINSIGYVGDEGVHH